MLYARRRLRIFGIGLIVAALVYVVFAIVAGDVRNLLIEIGGVAFFGTVSYLGMRRYALLLALGWALHVAWDLLLSSHAPWWYPAACIGFDLVVAGAILWAARRS